MNAPKVPDFDVADRMRKSLRTASLSVQAIADYLEVSRNTVSGWINGRVKPSVQTQRLWAMRTGVPYEWLRYGILPPESARTHLRRTCAARDSNPEPAD